MTISKLQLFRRTARGAKAGNEGVSRREVLAALLAGGALASVWSSASAALCKSRGIEREVKIESVGFIGERWELWTMEVV